MQQPSTEIYNLRAWITSTDPAYLKTTFEHFLYESGYGIINFTEHHFSPQGYTCIWLLCESHLAIHTFPEEEKTYVELSGCSLLMNKKFKVLFDVAFPISTILS